MALLELKNVSIDLPVFGFDAASLKKTVVRSVTGGRIKYETGVTVVRAIDGISLTLRDGDRLGVIGHNGAGKTTLLRTLAGVYPPTHGTYRRKGTIASFIDPMLGIEMDATGYENIRLRGLVMGLNHATISRLTSGIAEFSGLGDYLAMPVRTYSSGMLMRLAFSIVTSVRADILLLDEWLSAGDASFRERADQRMREVVSNTGILVLATHSRELVERECNRVIELAQGRVTSDTPIGPEESLTPAPQPA